VTLQPDPLASASNVGTHEANSGLGLNAPRTDGRGAANGRRRLYCTTASRGLAAKIIASYLRHNKLGVGDLPMLIASVHQSLASLGAPAALPKPHVPAVSVRRSVQPDYVVCLECGYRGQMLRRHLEGKHQLTPREYRARWDLPRSHPITAPSYSERRSTMAKEFGLGHKAASSTEQQIAETPTAAAPTPRKRRGRLRATPTQQIV